MDQDIETTNKSNSEMDSEEDVGCFFLQPSSSPYNITEKVEQANTDLFKTNLLNNDKSHRVTFKEDLVSYEPDLTDDDVNSLESDHAEVILDTAMHSFQYKTSIINPDSNIFDIAEEDDEIIEDIDTDFHEEGVTVVQALSSPTEEIHAGIEVNIERNQSPTCPEINNEETARMDCSPKRRRGKTKNKYAYLHTHAEVSCKNHCLDKLDFDLSMSIKKLDIHEKPIINFPPLKLLQRKCCDEIKTKFDRNLPTYNGLRSEYGLSLGQLQKREKRKEAIKQKEQTRQQLLQEYKYRRIQQNEEMFCRWLKDISRRKNEQLQKHDSTKNANSTQFSANVVSLAASKKSVKARQRPKTANEFIARSRSRRRPHTTHSCVFIEIPENVLRRGLHIGDLLVTNNNFPTKKLHILTLP